MQTADSQNGVSHVQRHSEFYFADGNITFLVENTFFRVHRSFFERESEVFIRELAQVPQDGISDDSAFQVEDVTSDDFATFLWVWYSPKYRLDRKSSDNWLVILELSTRWQFLEMRELAIDQLQNLKIDPVEKIAIYNKYEIDRSLLLPEYKHLCTRQGQMSIEEGEKVGLFTVLAIHQARERAMNSAVAKECRSPTLADVDDEKLEEILKDIFNLNQNSTTASRRGADIHAPSGDTDSQGVQAQGQSNAPPIIGTPQSNANRTTNRPFGTGWSPQNVNGQGDATGTDRT
ncbi:uncharacterized protein F5147DRAFT_716086 [Suillus discolor]|uniref:BTB domain-containing protein n=1 Tax=Suillus discolor TaxID=1912936 RepID=A0A9P7EZC5_9AGAM|nr:uncharacterized protein F5147DRAFT_716086 [Suillus discolor]KAG2096702.1 hypothetical protein F5147DRAFT_716086 [Suillus discolor]